MATWACLLQERFATSATFKALAPDAGRCLATALLQAVLRYTDAVAVVSAATPWADDSATSPLQSARMRDHRTNVWELPRAAPPEASLRGASLSLDLFGSGGAAAAVAAAAAAARDTPAYHLECVAALLDAAVDPASGEPLPATLPGPARDAFLNFISAAARSEALHRTGVAGFGAPARCGVLRVMRAFACTRDAAAQIMTQLELHAEHEEYMHLSWARYCHLLAEARRKYKDYEALHGYGAVASSGTRSSGPRCIACDLHQCVWRARGCLRSGAGSMGADDACARFTLAVVVQGLTMR
jgi:hypothetical protein